MDELAQQFGLFPILDAVAASDAVRQGQDPTQLMGGRSRDMSAYLQAQQQQQQALALEEQKRTLIAQQQQKAAEDEAIRRQQLLQSLMDLSGRTPYQDMGGGPSGVELPGRASGNFTNADISRVAQTAGPVQPPMDAIDRLFQMGPQMPKELFDALLQGSLKDQIAPAASPEALRSFFPGMSPEQLSGMGRVPQKRLQDVAIDKAKGEDRIAATLEGYRMRAQEGQLNRASREAMMTERLSQQEKQFQQNQSRMSAADAGRSQRPIPAQLAAKFISEAAASGASVEAQEAMLSGMGYSSAGIIDKGAGMFSSGTPTVVPGQAGGPAPKAAAPAPQADRVTVEKDGKRFSLPKSQLEQASKQGYKQVK